MYKPYIILLFVFLCITGCKTNSVNPNMHQLVQNSVGCDSQDIKDCVTKAEQGDAISQLVLGAMFLKGKNVEQDYKMALSWFKKSAEQGIADAQYRTGMMYNYEIGVEQSYKQAYIWYKKAASQGYPLAQYELSILYQEGLGTEKNLQKAFELLEMSANQGIAEAQYNLGTYYEFGFYVQQDYAEAVKWYKKSANQGIAEAQNNLGSMYKNGLGVAQSYEKALNWYLKSAEQGDSTAQYNTAVIYYNGYGVPKDYAKAYMFWTLSSANGELEADYAKQSLTRIMTSTEIEVAQVSTRAWVYLHKNSVTNSKNHDFLFLKENFSSSYINTNPSISTETEITNPNLDDFCLDELNNKNSLLCDDNNSLVGDQQLDEPHKNFYQQDSPLKEYALKPIEPVKLDDSKSEDWMSNCSNFNNQNNKDSAESCDRY